MTGVQTCALPICLWVLWRSRRPLFWGGLLLAAILPVAIFYGGFYRHDYYWSALTPEVAAVVGLGAAWLFERAQTRPRRVMVVVTLILAVVLSLQSSREYWSLAYPPLNDFEQVLPRARELAAQSHADDTVVMIGRSSDPDLPYYARRRAMMLRPENQTDHLLRRLATEDYHILFSWNPRFDPIWVVDYWRWAGVVSAHTYTLGASPQDLRAPPILTTDNTSEIDALSRDGATSLLSAPLHVP